MPAHWWQVNSNEAVLNDWIAVMAVQILTALRPAVLDWTGEKQRSVGARPWRCISHPTPQFELRSIPDATALQRRPGAGRPLCDHDVSR